LKQKFIPLDKQSKKKRREYHASHRKGWGGLNPVTRKPPDPKIYNRKKAGPRFDEESQPGFLFSS